MVIPYGVAGRTREDSNSEKPVNSRRRTLGEEWWREGRGNSPTEDVQIKRKTGRPPSARQREVEPTPTSTRPESSLGKRLKS